MAHVWSRHSFTKCAWLGPPPSQGNKGLKVHSVEGIGREGKALALVP